MSHEQIRNIFLKGIIQIIYHAWFNSLVRDNSFFKAILEVGSTSCQSPVKLVPYDLEILQICVKFSNIHSLKVLVASL